MDMLLSTNSVLTIGMLLGHMNLEAKRQRKELMLKIFPKADDVIIKSFMAFSS